MRRHWIESERAVGMQSQGTAEAPFGARCWQEAMASIFERFLEHLNQLGKVVDPGPPSMLLSVIVLTRKRLHTPY